MLSRYVSEKLASPVHSLSQTTTGACLMTRKAELKHRIRRMAEDVLDCMRHGSKQAILNDFVVELEIACRRYRDLLELEKARRNTHRKSRKWRRTGEPPS